MLADVVIETRKIVFRGGEFEVQGLTFDMVARLVTAGHRGELDKAIELFQGLQVGSDDTDVIGSLSSLITMAPVLAAKAIALGCGEMDQWEKARSLPMPVQLDALLAIGKLTFDGADSVKNFLRGLQDLLSGMTPLLQGSNSQTAEEPTGSKS
jgi:hypothetical protein